MGSARAFRAPLVLRGRERLDAACLAIRVALSLYWGAAAVYKFTHLARHVHAAVRLAPEWADPELVARLAYAVPVLELGVAVFLLSRSHRVFGAWLSIALLCVFTAVLTTAAFAEGRAPQCACTWPVLQVAAPGDAVMMTIRNATLVAAALVVWLRDRGPSESAFRRS